MRSDRESAVDGGILHLISVLQGLCQNSCITRVLKEHITYYEIVPLPHTLAGNCFVCMLGSLTCFFPCKEVSAQIVLLLCWPAVGNRSKLARKHQRWAITSDVWLLSVFSVNLNDAFNIAWIIGWRLTDLFFHYLKIHTVGPRAANFIILFTVWVSRPPANQSSCFLRL